MMDEARPCIRSRGRPSRRSAAFLGAALLAILITWVWSAEKDGRPATIKIHTSPEGAEIRLDGKDKVVGVAPWTGEVTAGDHEIQVDLAGFMPAAVTVTLAPGDVKEIVFDLLTGTPVLVPEAEEGFIRRQDKAFRWPSESRLRGRDTAPMILVPAGEFTMGSQSSDLPAASWEKPAHVVRLRAFLIDRYEVPNARYRQFLEEIRIFGHRSCDPSEPPGKDHAPGELAMRGTEWNQSAQPVTEVDWWDAAAYCAWAGGRLPTEAEWEKAARGTDGRAYAWGNDPPGASRQGNFADLSFKYRNPDWTWIVPKYDDGHAFVAPIGSYPGGASPYGAEDMAGNVWEWVSDWYGPEYYRTSPPADPRGPATGTHRVVRGGSWNDAGWDLRVASRLKFPPDFRTRTVGFRCAQETR